MHNDKKERLHKCTKGFTLPMYDDDGYEVENMFIVVRKGDVFKRTSEKVLGDLVHLEDTLPPFNWIEITEERFKECFTK